MHYTVCLLFNEDGNEILLQKKKKTKFAGRWNGVGGKTEVTDKNNEYAAAREIEEETGLITLPSQLTWIGDMRLPYNCERETDECVLHWYAGKVCDAFYGIPMQHQYEERLQWHSVNDVLKRAVHDQTLAGNGNLQYMMNVARIMLFEKGDFYGGGDEQW